MRDRRPGPPRRGGGEAGRVIAGVARGIRLLAPGPGTRPFADRVKQALFAVLEPDLPGARFLDLFAGSGAAGIEALSRGAAEATFVERDAGAVRTIDENLRRAGLGARARVVRADAERWLRASVDERGWQVVLVDPPYADADLLRRVLDHLGAEGTVALGGRVVVKHFWRDTPPAEVGLLASERARRFGESALTFYRAAPADAAARGDEEER